MNFFDFLSRFIRESGLFNTFNSRTVEIIMQKSPGNLQGDKRGIDKLDYKVEINGREIIKDKTGPDGKIQVRVRGRATSILKLLHNNIVVASYEVTSSTDALAAKTTTLGQKQRMRMLGYQLGHAGPDQDGVDIVNNNMEFERSILDFQVESSMLNDAKITDNADQDKLETEAGA